MSREQRGALQRSSRRVVAGVLVGLALFGAGACNLFFGIDAPVLVDGDGGEGGDAGSGELACRRHSECADLDASYLCLFEVCSPPCDRDVDCTVLGSGYSCLKTEEGSACVSSEQTSCSAADGEGACPLGTTCHEDVCKTTCAAGCGDGQACSEVAGVCGPATVDPSEPGAPCDVPGAIACVGFASAGRVICQDDVWTEHEPCEDGAFCNNAGTPSGQCAPVPAECEGRAPDVPFCVGSVRTVCGADLVTIDSAECDSVQHCTQATTAACATCLPNEYKCEGDELQVCRDALDGFDAVKTCDDPSEPCSASAEDCSATFCTPGLSRCVGDDLYTCSEDGGEETSVNCGVGRCDGVNRECVPCPLPVPTAAQTTFACESNAWAIDSCSGSYEHCDSLIVENGCETNTDASATHCGACGNNCSANVPNYASVGSPGCSAGICNYVCNSGRGNCNTMWSDGCETNTNTSTSHCGSCGESCGSGSPICFEGDCVECTPSTSGCEGSTPYTCPSGDKVLAAACATPSQICRTGSCVSSAVTLGFPTAFTSLTTQPAGRLHAFPVVLAYPATLAQIGLYGRSNTGVFARMAVYRDSGGYPSTLVAQSSNMQIPAEATVKSAASPQAALTAGTYWIAVKYDGVANLYRSGLTPGAAALRYLDIADSFATAFPATFPGGASEIAERQYNYFIELQYTQE